MASTNITPPLSCLYPATFDFTKSLISCSVILAPTTTKARGTSVASCSTPITAASRIFSCERRRASNSAGATCKPLYLISSYHAISKSFVAPERGKYYLLPVYNIDQAIPDLGHISSTKPAVDKGLLSCFWIIMISFGDYRTFDKDFSSLSWFDILPIVIDKSKLLKVRSAKQELVSEIGLRTSSSY